MKFSTLLFLLVSKAGAFSLPSPSVRSATQLASTAAEARPDFYQAVQAAASTSSSISIDELERMATELESVDGCAFEDGEELCDKEIQDRLDVAGVLRLKIELQLRQDYLKNANLFADDVRKVHDSEERQKFKEELIANREKAAEAQSGSDLGLW